MGCFNNRRKKLSELLILSNGTLKEQQTEEIMMKTFFSLDDLINLYKEYIKLSPDNSMRIKVTSFMDLPQFKHCPFRACIIKAYGFDSKLFNKHYIKKEINEKHGLSNKNNIKIEKHTSGIEIYDSNPYTKLTTSDNKRDANLKSSYFLDKFNFNQIKNVNDKKEKSNLHLEDNKLQGNIFKESKFKSNNFVYFDDRIIDNKEYIHNDEIRDYECKLNINNYKISI